MLVGSLTGAVPPPFVQQSPPVTPTAPFLSPGCATTMYIAYIFHVHTYVLWCVRDNIFSVNDCFCLEPRTVDVYSKICVVVSAISRLSFRRSYALAQPCMWRCSCVCVADTSTTTYSTFLSQQLMCLAGTPILHIHSATFSPIKPQPFKMDLQTITHRLVSRFVQRFYSSLWPIHVRHYKILVFCLAIEQHVHVFWDDL